MPTRPASPVLQLLFAAFLLQACPSTLMAAKDASGWFSPHCDGASFYLFKVEGLPSKQKINLNLRQHFSWWNYRPQEVWEDVYAERCTSIGKCEAATHARIFEDSDVLGRLAEMRAEIMALEDEEQRRRAAARVALGVVYGL